MPAVACPASALLSRQAIWPNSLLDRAVAVLKLSGFEAEVTDTIEQRIWEKLMINVGINALTAIHDLANGRLLDDPALTATMRAAIAEAEEVAKARGIVSDRRLLFQNRRRLSGHRCQHLVHAAGCPPPETDGNRCDQRRHRPAWPGSLGIEVPVNRRLTAQIKKLEQSYL